MQLARIVAHGVVAASLGILAIDAVTYADMAITRRPAASLPAETARALARKFGLFDRLNPAEEAQAAHRWTALGALLGYVNGVASGVGYALVRHAVPGPSWRVGALALAAQTMLAADGSATLLGATDPRDWDAAARFRAFYPRAVFGAVVAGVVRSSELRS